MQRSRKGFTLIELLVVIAIIGLLSTLAVVALNSARQKARDAKRVADIKQVQTALELYFNDNDSYPPMIGTVNILGEAATGGDDCSASGDVTCGCLDNGGFKDSSTCGDDAPVYMGLMPSNPRPPADTPYAYVAELPSSGGDCNPGDACASYSISFELEGAIPTLGAGTTCVATPDGLTCS